MVKWRSWDVMKSKVYLTASKDSGAYYKLEMYIIL